MKRFFLLAICLTAMSAVAFADKDKAITVDQLPQKAQEFIAKYFAGIEVSYVKMESDLFDKSYDVIFVTGNKVEFDKKGEWTAIDCKYTEVPTDIVPQKIQDFIAKHQPNTKVVKIEKDNDGYELKLDNRAEPKFDLNKNFMGYDD